MRHFDATKRNFGFSVRDIWELLPVSNETNNKTFFIFNEEGLCDTRVEKEFSGTFAAPSYDGSRYLSFKYTLRITTHLYKNDVDSWTQFWVDLDD